MFQTEVQMAVTRYLKAHAYFKGDGTQKPIDVIAGNDRGLMGKAAEAMARLGMCVIVAPLGGDFGDRNTSCPYMEPARFTCRVRENQAINRGASGTGQSADYVAEVCAVLLQHYVPIAENGTPLGGGGIVLTGMSPGEDMEGITAWDLIWTYDGGVSHEPVRRDFSSLPLPGAAPT